MRGLLFVLLVAVLPSGAYAQCSGAGGVPFNCKAATTPTTADLVLGGQGTNTVKWNWGQVLGAGMPGVFSTLSSTGGTLNLAGGSKITSNANLVDLSSNNGLIVQVYDNGAAVGTHLNLTGNTTGNQFQISTSGAAGVQVVSPFQVQHNFAYSGTSSISQTNLTASSLVSGTSADTVSYSINNIADILTLTTSSAPFGTSITNTLGAGFYGPSNGLFSATSQSGAPGSVAAWASASAYTTVGQMVQNLQSSGVNNVYALVTAGTSAGSGGPTGTGSSISDGTAVWRYVSAITNLYYQTDLGVQQNVHYSVGGTAAAPAGIFFGAGMGVYADCLGSAPHCATGINELIGAEIDAGMTAGTSALRRVALQVVSTTAGAQGSFEDWGIAISGQGAGNFITPLIFSDGSTDANGYAISIWGQNTGGLQTMAGAIDLMRVNANGAGRAGGGFIERWANGQITNPTGQYAGGDLYLGAASLHVTTTGLTIDAPLYALGGSSPTIVSGGTLWSTGTWATDGFGNWGQVTANGSGVVTALTVTTFGNQPAAHNGTIAWHADNASTILTASGSNASGTDFTVTEAWAQVSSPLITLGGTAAVAIAGKVGFYGTSPIAKATPVGACAGNTGCQALRDAMVNLGLIVGTSITN